MATVAIGGRAQAAGGVSIEELLYVSPVMGDSLSTARLVRADFDLSDRDLAQESDHKWGGWAGFSFGLFYPDLSGFGGMTSDRGLDDFNPTLNTWSGRAFLSYNNWRLGAEGGGGHYRVDKWVNGDHRWAQMDIGWGGITLDYYFPITEKVGVFGGGLVGWGGAWMGADGKDLGDSWAAGAGFSLLAPGAGVSVKPFPFLRIEASGRYLFADIDTHGSAFVASSGKTLVKTDSISGPLFGVWLLFGYGN